MRYVADDDFESNVEIGTEEFSTPSYPTDIELMGAFNDPLIMLGIDQAIDEAVMLGIDLDDPELMGGWLKKLIKKVKKRRAKRRSKGNVVMPTVSIDTAQGQATIGPDGVTWIDPATGMQTVGTPGAQPQSGGIADMLKNPMVLGGGAAALLLLVIMMKRRRR